MAVGAAHQLGDDGVIAWLRKNGYAIEIAGVCASAGKRTATASPKRDAAGTAVARVRAAGVVMGTLEVIARIKIRPGQMEGFKVQAAELVKLTREKDTQTLRYDWFINENAMECEVHEAYRNERGMLEHSAHVMDARRVLFEKYAYDHKMSFFGDVSPQLMELAKQHAEGAAAYSFVAGLDATPPAEVKSASASL